MMHEKINVALVGAKTLVGEAVLELLAAHAFPVAKLYALDDEAHAGESVSFGNLELDIGLTDDFLFEHAQLVIFTAGGAVARSFVPDALAAGCAVIDFSDAYRADSGVPLVVPGVNEDAWGEGERLIVVPNCTVSPLAQALAPFASQLQRVTVSTYQSVSGAGVGAMEEMAAQTTALFSQREAEVAHFAKRIAFNVLPQIGDTDDAGDSAEERSVRDELRRLLALPQLAVEATCVRVPVFFGHGWSVAMALSGAPGREQVLQRLARAGVRVVEAGDSFGPYITPMEATGNEGVWASRVRVDGASVRFWLAADNVRAGAAAGIVRVAETMLTRGYFA